MQYGGLQNDKYYMMGLQCKHYAAYDLESIPESRTKFNAKVDAVNWAETYSVPFRECVVRYVYTNRSIYVCIVQFLCMYMYIVQMQHK